MEAAQPVCPSSRDHSLKVLNTQRFRLSGASAVARAGYASCLFVLVSSHAVAYAQPNHTELALATELLREASRAASAIKDDEVVSGCCTAQHWKLRVYNQIAGAQAELRDQEGIKETATFAVQAAKGAAAAALLLATIGTSQAKAGDLVGGVHTLEQSLEAAHTIEKDVVRNSLLWMIARGFASAGKIQRALTLADSINDDLVKVSAQADVAVAQVKAGDREAGTTIFDKARQVATGIKDPRDRAVAYHNIALAMSKSMDRKGAQGMMKEALAAAGKIADDAGKADLLNMLGAGYIEMGDTEEAQRVLAQAANAANHIGMESDRADRLWRIARNQVNSGNREAAEATLHQASQSAKRIQDAFEQANALISIATAYTATGNRGAAQESLQQAAQIITGITNQGLKSSILMQLATAQAQAGHVQAAIETAMTTDNYAHAQAWALRDIAIEQARAGDLEGAVKSVRAIKDGQSQQTEAWRAIANARVRRGDSREAHAWVIQQTAHLDKVTALLGVAEGILHIQ